MPATYLHYIVIVWLGLPQQWIKYHVAKENYALFSLLKAINPCNQTNDCFLDDGLLRSPVSNAEPNDVSQPILEVSDDLSLCKRAASSLEFLTESTGDK